MSGSDALAIASKLPAVPEPRGYSLGLKPWAGKMFKADLEFDAMLELIEADRKALDVRVNASYQTLDA
jgi:hypothetical protein